VGRAFYRYRRNWQSALVCGAYRDSAFSSELGVMLSYLMHKSMKKKTMPPPTFTFTLLAAPTFFATA
jgi:hypothetical protein